MAATHRIFRLMLLVAVSLLVVGCGDKKVEPEPDGMEKWRILSERAVGHSPSPRVLSEKDTFEAYAVDEPEILNEERVKQEKHLPTFEVSLRMHNANLIAVLQALSRAAKQSIVVSPNVEGAVNINIHKRPWDQVFKGVLSANQLSYSWEGDIIRVMTAADMQHDLDMEILRKKRQQERLAMQRVEPLRTAVVKVSYADAEKLKTSMDKLLSKDMESNVLGSVEVDKNTNSLIIQAIPQDMKRLITLAHRLDKPRAQIRLKAHIIETTKDTARALGVQWGGMYEGRMANGNNLYFVPGGTDGPTDYNPVLNKTKPGVSGQGYGINFLPDAALFESGNGAALGVMLGKFGGSILEAQLRALEQDNRLNIISSPSITTMDNQLAFTESGERVPFQTTSDDGVNIEFEDVVLRLEITPHIIDDEFIKLEILVKKDEVGTKTVGDNPRITKKQTQTTLIARNTETLVITGLNKLKAQNDDQGIPGLRETPVLHWMFGSKTKRNILDEFMIFITPEILGQWKPGEKNVSLKQVEQELEAKRKRLEEEKKAKEEANKK